MTLNGTSLDVLKTAPQVAEAQYSGLYQPTDDDPDLALINAVQAWGGGGAAGAGAGIKVAIIDTGIEETHPCFSGWGDSDGANNHTNNKVIVAKVFANKAAQLGFDEAAVQDHGTHVAGTVACNVGTTAVVEGVTIPHTTVRRVGARLGRPVSAALTAPRAASAHAPRPRAASAASALPSSHAGRATSR